MKSINYLTDKLRKLHERCMFLDIKYEYKSYLNTHVIDVRPKDVFENNELYVSCQMSLEDDFEIMFPTEDIVFISDDALISVDEAIFEISSVNIDEINVEKFDVLESEHIYFEEFINIDIIGYEDVSYKSLNDYDFIQVDSELNNEILMKTHPPKPWWKSITNKKSSKKDLELFFA